MVDALKARENKIKLLHNLNAFRSIQRRLTYDLAEMGTRERVIGDAVIIAPRDEKLAAEEAKEDL